jgi:hypothetical protein
VSLSGSGKIRSADGPGAPLQVGELVVLAGSKVTADKLEIGASLDLSGDSGLSPGSEGDYITLNNATVDIVFRAKALDFPALSLGNIGATYDVVPKSLELDFANVDLKQDKHWNLVQGNTLSNCEQWLAMVRVLDVPKGVDEKKQLVLDCPKGSAARRIADALETISLRLTYVYTIPAPPKATNKLYAGLELGAWIGIGVSVIVCIVICIVVQVFCCKAKDGDDDASESNLSA